MLSFLLRRSLQGVAIVLAVVTFVFALLHAAPGEPFAELDTDPRVTSEMRTQIRARYALDRPVGEQYAHWLGALVQGELGLSYARQRPVRQVLGDALPRTGLLVGTALALGFALGILVGALQALRAGSLLDRLLTRVTVTASAVPDFWLALGLMLVFAVKLRWLPSAGMADDAMFAYLTPLERVRDLAMHLVLPASTLTIVLASIVARQQRAALMETLPDDYVRTARAKGLGERAILLRHALRNALLPTITLLALVLPTLVGGALFVETIFAWPGMGKVAADAIAQRDYPVVLGVTLLASIVVVVTSILADVVYAAADPRIRRG